MDGMFNRLLAPHLARIYPCKLSETDRSKGQKEQRIVDTLEPVMNQHRLVVDKALIERDYASTKEHPTELQNIYRLFYQLTRITRDRGALKKDDRLDALAMAVHYWTKQMAQDTERAAAQAREAALEGELRKFLQAVTGAGRAAPSLVRKVL